jgi:hypothetical protein
MLSERKLKSLIVETVIEDISRDPLYPSYGEMRKAEIIAENLFGKIAKSITSIFGDEKQTIDGLVEQVGSKIEGLAEKLNKYVKLFIKKNATTSESNVNEWSQADLDWLLTEMSENRNPYASLLLEDGGIISGPLLTYAAIMGFTKLLDLLRKVATWFAKRKEYIDQEQSDILQDDLLRFVAPAGRPNEKEKDRKRREAKLAKQAPYIDRSSVEQRNTMFGGVGTQKMSSAGDKVRTHRNLEKAQHQLDHDLESEAQMKKLKEIIDGGQTAETRVLIWLINWKKAMHAIEKILDKPFKLIGSAIGWIINKLAPDYDEDNVNDWMYKITKYSFLAWAFQHAIHSLEQVYHGHGGTGEVLSKIKDAAIEGEEATQVLTMESTSASEGVIVKAVQSIAASIEGAWAGCNGATEAIMISTVACMQEKKKNSSEDSGSSESYIDQERMANAYTGSRRNRNLDEAIQRILRKKMLHA